MPLEAAGRDTMADAFAAAYTWLALFNAGTELSGAGYTRIQVTLDSSANDGTVAIPAQAGFNVPSGQRVTQFALFTAQTAGTRGALEAIDTPTPVYAADGTFNYSGGTVTVT